MATGDKLVTLDGLKAVYDYTQTSLGELLPVDMSGMSAVGLYIDIKVAGSSLKATQGPRLIAIPAKDVYEFSLSCSVESTKRVGFVDTVEAAATVYNPAEYTGQLSEKAINTGNHNYLVVQLFITSDSDTDATHYIPYLTVTKKTAVDNVARNSISALSNEMDATVPPSIHGKNILYGMDWANGYLLSATTVKADANYKTTDYIDVSGFVHNVCVSPKLRQWAEYLENKTPNTEATDSGYHNGAINNAVLTPHANTKYIRVTMHTADVDGGTAQIEDNTACSYYEDPYLALGEMYGLNNFQKSSVKDISGNRLRGKKWAICGDSFSAGDFSGSPTQDYTIESGKYAGMKAVYGYLIGNRNDMDIQMLAVNGATMATPADGTFYNAFSDDTNTGKQVGNLTVHNYTEIDSDVDFITLYYGVNDSHHAIGQSGVIPVGELSDATTDTFYGAWNVVIGYIREHYPFAHVGIIVSNGTDAAAYPQALKAIAAKWGLPYIDLNGDERTPAMLRPVNDNLSDAVKANLLATQAVRPEEDTTVDPPISANRHPNAKAHLFESWLIENFLRSI